MSSALDEDTQEALAEGRDTLFSMLRSAQKDLQKVVLVVLFAFLLTFWTLRTYIWDRLKIMTESRMRAEVGDSFEVIAQTPFEVILLQAKIGIFVGVLVGIPVFLYYTRDALRQRGYWPQTPIPRWKLALIGALSATLFVLGTAYGYSFFFPFMFGFLAGFGYDAGFAPTYSIVMWTEFIILLSISFGLAAQMPLFVTALSYAEIVSYETFRDKWRHAVLGIFIFGAFFSPPDPFTQIMWAVPLIVLYGASLYLAKIVVTAKRGSERIDVPKVARNHWNVLLGTFALGIAVVYAFYTYGGRQLTNEALVWIGSDYRILEPGGTLGLTEPAAIGLYGALVGVLFVAVALAYFVYSDITASVATDPDLGDPTEIDLSELDAAGIEAAPIEAFETLSEDEALGYAGHALEHDRPEKAQAILDRFDEAQATAEDTGDGDDSEDDSTEDDADVDDSLSGRASRASDTFLEDFTDGETDSDDIGGYYKDVVFIIDSLRSRSFRIVGTFLVAMAGVFAWLYVGGLGAVREDFYARLPEDVTADQITVITLHPVEALIFMVKFSVLVGIIAVLPMIAYYAWPRLRELGFVRGRQRTVYVWTAALTGGLVGGFALGYLFIAPATISWLAADALAAEMIISYRINDFMWLIIFLTAGIGLLADIPILMLLLNRAGVPYRAMRKRWREVFLTMLTLAAVFTPADIMTMFLVTIPLMAAYGVGLFVLFFVTLGGRRDLAPPADFIGEGITGSSD